MSDAPPSLRVEYEGDALDEASIARDPFVQFGAWLDDAIARDDIIEPVAMTLATAIKGVPSARTVLLRGHDSRGFVFFTNYESRKAQELAADPHAALLFYWAPLSRQVRIEGKAEQITSEESDEYFKSRPRGHQLATWASAQSRPIDERAVLVTAFRAAEERFVGREVERPRAWGGYRVSADRFEFWQGRPNRLHDRIAYERDGRAWRIQRLAP